MVIGRTLQLTSKHNHSTSYNQNRILYYLLIKCSNVIFQGFVCLFFTKNVSCSGTIQPCLDLETEFNSVFEIFACFELFIHSLVIIMQPIESIYSM